MIHVGLDELEGFILDVLHSLAVEFLSQILYLLTRDALTVFGSLEAFDDDSDHIGETFDTLTHAQTEVAEPLVVKADCPVFRQELNYVGDYTSVESACEGIEVVFVQANE